MAISEISHFIFIILKVRKPQPLLENDIVTVHAALLTDN